MAQFAGSTAVTTGAGASTQGLLISSNPSISTPSSTLLRHLPAVSVTSSLVCPRTSSSSCCDNGRPLVTDPLTGQSVCACQLDANSAAASAMFLGLSTRLGPPGPPGPPPPPHPPGLGTPHPSLGLGLGLYGAYAAAAAAAAASAPGDQSQLYAASAGGHDLKDTLALNGGAGSGPGGPGLWPYPAASMYYPYDPSLAAAAYPFAGYGMDLNGARRKNATRETTATLKAWLSEHKKNPYPTKGEKIMLAIITKMTLTQVSTWFANARRRLKKENKMTWEPKNRNDDEDDDSDAGESDDTRKDKNTPDCPRSDMTIHRSVNEWSSEMSSNKSPSPSSEDGDHRHDESRSGDINVDSDSEELDLLSSDSCMSPSEARSADTLASLPTQKPKIWSLADMANVPSQSPATTAAAVATGGKMILPRVPMDSPYARGPAYRGYPPLDPRIYYAARATAAAAAAATTGHLDTTTPAGKLLGNSPVENLEKMAAMANRGEKC